MIGGIARPICKDRNISDVPRPQECLEYFLRVHLTVNGFDYKKHLKQVHVRPCVLLALFFFLIDRNHEVFRGKGTAEQLRDKMRQAVEAEYPDNEKHLSEEQRRVYISESLVEALESFIMMQKLQYKSAHTNDFAS